MFSAKLVRLGAEVNDGAHTPTGFVCFYTSVHAELLLPAKADDYMLIKFPVGSCSCSAVLLQLCSSAALLSPCLVSDIMKTAQG